MNQKIDFGGGLQALGRLALREIVKTDYGPGCSFNGIGGHGLSTHGGTHECHNQVTLFQSGVKGSGTTLRIFDK